MKVQNAIRMGSGVSDKDQQARAMADPEIQAILGDQRIQAVLKLMQEQPEKINEILQDQEIADKIDKLIAAGVLKVGSQ